MYIRIIGGRKVDYNVCDGDNVICISDDVVYYYDGFGGKHICDGSALTKGRVYNSVSVLVLGNGYHVYYLFDDSGYWRGYGGEFFMLLGDYRDKRLEGLLDG